MRHLLFILVTFAFASCSSLGSFNKDKTAFENSPVTMSFKSVADMNDAYFVIKENNFCEFYRQLFDSVKNNSLPGRYNLVNDTLYLKFYDKKGADLLGSKAVIHKTENKIIFFK